MELTTTYPEYIQLLHLWNNIILFACILGFGLSIVLHRFWHGDNKVSNTAPTLSFWIVLFTVGLVLRLPMVNNKPWYDETYSWLMATADWSAFPAALLSDVHPPLFYMLQRLMVGLFGPEMWALRLPSMVAGLALPWVVYRYSYLMSGSHNTGKIAAGLVVILPQMIYYSTDARYPMLLAVVILLAMIAILEDKPVRFAVLAALPVYLHSMGIFYAGMLAIGALVYRPSRQWLLAAAFAGCLGVLWMPGILLQSQTVGNGFWLQLEYPITFVPDMTTGRFTPIYPLFILWVLMFGLSFRALWFKWDRGVVVWALVAVGVPLIAWVISVLWSTIYLPRALMASTVLFLPLWADVLRRIPVLMVIGAGLLAFPLYGLYTTDRAPMSEAFDLCRGAANVYTTGNTVAIPALYYLPDKPIHIWEQSNQTDLTTELTPAIQSAFNLHIAENPDELDDVCIIAIIDPYTSAEETQELERLANSPGTHLQMVYIPKRKYHFAVIRLS